MKHDLTSRDLAYLVTLEKAIREDDSEREGVLNAIRMIRGVRLVTPVKNDINKQLAIQKAKTELIDKLYEVLQP